MMGREGNRTIHNSSTINTNHSLSCAFPEDNRKLILNVCVAHISWFLADELLVLLVFWASLVLTFLRNIGITLAECSTRHSGHAIDKLSLEQDIGVSEHAVL